MTTVHGSVGQFSGIAEEWPSYVERLQFYFAANDVDGDRKKRAILLSCCGSATYSLIRSLVAPSKPDEVSLQAIIDKVNAHYNPRPSAIVQRFKFNSRSQQPGESLATYVAELRKLSEFCEYGDQLDQMLRDRLVCGIADTRCQQRLLAEVELTFDKAFKLAQAMEVAERDSKQLKPSEAASSLPIQKVENQFHSGKKVSKGKPCYRCGGMHDSRQCRFQHVNCNSCGKKGHIKRVCRSKPTPTVGQLRGETTVHTTEAVTPAEDITEYYLYPVRDSQASPLQTVVLINDRPVSMEVDTGAAVTVISKHQLAQIYPTLPLLQPTPVKLRTYTGSEIPVAGTLTVKVQHQQQSIELPVIVVEGSGPNLLGRDWLAHIRLDWQAMFSTHLDESLSNLIKRHEPVFQAGLGTIKDLKATLQCKPEVSPRFFKYRSVPHAMRAAVEKELDRLEDEGIIVPVQHSDWAAPIVPVPKSDGSVRICGDFKLTANAATNLEVYPLPRIEDIFASLSGGKQFSKLDLAQAYLQLSLAEESQPLVTINTHKGLYRYQRLPFGVASAPAIFQRTMETLLQGIPNVSVYLDDILITGASTADHLRNLDEVLQRLENAGMRLKKEKCAYLLDEIEYLGHKITKEGLQPTESKVRAVAHAPVPTRVSELRSFLGLINYYGKFVPHLSTTAAPLYSLLQKNTPWHWSTAQQSAFDEIKGLLQSSDLLVHFDPHKEIILSCDASPYGLGAVLSHRMEDNTERPIAYASRTLAPAERKYSQLDKEALAIIFGVKHFHQYVYGRTFTIQSDHKPLQYIFDESKPVPSMTSARVQRWALTLGAYSYHICHKAGKDHGNADGLSRLPLPEAPVQVPQPAELINLMERMDSAPVSSQDIQTHTSRDPVLAKVRDLVRQGWPSSVTTRDLYPFATMQQELSVEQGCLLRGSRVVVPASLRGEIVKLLHDGHPGVVRMKMLARQYVWWPGIDKDVENSVKSCIPCQESRKSPPQAPLHPWEWPEKPWVRIHVDYAGPFMGHMFLVIVDAHSKWMEVYPTTSSSSQVTIEKLRMCFASLGLPEQLVSDNGPSFVSVDFQQFMKNNGIRHIRTSPHHPSSNGQAERAVQTFKSSMKRFTEGTVLTKVTRFLLHYRTTPHSVTGQSPAELMFNRKLRTRLDLLKPNLGSYVRSQQENQKSVHDQHSKQREFAVGVQIFMRNFGPGNSWLPGKVVQQRGPLSYLVKLEDGRYFRRHLDHLRIRTCSGSTMASETSSYLPWPEVTTPDSHQPTVPMQPTPPPLRRSSRPSNPPDRYGIAIPH